MSCRAAAMFQVRRHHPPLRAPAGPTPPAAGPQSHLPAGRGGGGGDDSDRGRGGPPATLLLTAPFRPRHGLEKAPFWVGTSQRSMATPLPSPLICPVQVDVTRKIVTILKLIAVKVRGYAFSGYPPPPRRRRGAAPLGFPAAAL